MSDLPQVLRDAAAVLEDRIKHEHGVPASGETRSLAGQACITLCDGDQDKARTLWKLIAGELGYMPHGAAVSLIRASSTKNLVPDIEAPDLDYASRGFAGESKS